ncbi:hypothetical protein [Streptomyces sp. SLBN-31]|uniref:hypothetical protein n=1 Tax=Streptomyces sp. SLBN-31 TaxID=2768444 RepID=UPI001152928B|nr:hypothetical protein [Streptomyces sp. SLBN-31]TQJ90012.1 hypothetical protein FBY22_0781 [Streptomyces sp. SLBN-31]
MTGPTPAPPANPRICSNCDGFATVAISSGLGRDARGHLHTLMVDCRACSGAGTVPAPARLLAGGRA